jgi:tetratricopeptide (TPR) repeat protein
MNNGWRSFLPQAALIALVVAVAYTPVLHAGFVFDDPFLITEDPLIKASGGLYRFWFTTEAPDYYPMTWTLFWSEWRLWGSNPMGYHVLNVLLHAANVVLIWVLLRRLRIPGAWLAALVFGLHPVNVATVAWVSEQKNTLSMLFYAVAVLLYLEFDETRRWRWYGLSLAAFLLALLSKAAVVMLPVVLLGCVWWTRGRVIGRHVLHSVPFFALSLTLGLFTMWYQYHVPLGLPVVGTDGFAFRLAVAGCVPWSYLGKALLPVNLMVVYPKWQIDASGWVAYLPGTALIACFLVFWWKRRTWGRPLLFGLGYFVVMLFPVLGLLKQGPNRFTYIADRWDHYQYYSIVGIIALAVASLEKLSLRLGRPGRSAAKVMGVCVLALLTAGTWKRAGIYADNITLWRDNVAKNPGPWPHNLLGCALEQRGEFDEAIREFQAALQINPDYFEVHSNLGTTLSEAGNVSEAIRQWREALRLNPRAERAHNDLGSALQRRGQLAEARDHFEQAVRLMPDYAEAHNNLGINFAAAGEYDEAVRQFEQALRIWPGFAEAHYGLGNALITLHKPADALAHYKLALQFKPDYPDAQHNMGVALVQLGRVQEAVGCYEEFLRANPKDARGWHDLGIVLAQAGRYQEAIGQFEQAVRIDPDYAEAHYDLGIALEQSGRYPEAIGHYEQALCIRPDYREAQDRLKRLETGG